MLRFDDLYATKEFQHPKLRYWDSLAQGAKHDPSIDIDRRRGTLGFGPARIVFEVTSSTGEPKQDLELWHPQLALETIQRGWRGRDHKAEVVRVGLLLKHFFSQAESRYGDGFFSSVLIEVLRESDLTDAPDLKEVLRLVCVDAPMESPSRGECAEAIAAAIARATQLTKGLGYEAAQTKSILADAIAYYLDDRFSITEGRQLGLYRDP